MGTLIVGLVILLFVLVSVYTSCMTIKVGLERVAATAPPVAAVPSIRLLKRNNLHVGYKKGAA